MNERATPHWIPQFGWSVRWSQQMKCTECSPLLPRIHGAHKIDWVVKFLWDSFSLISSRGSEAIFVHVGNSLLLRKAVKLPLHAPGKEPASVVYYPNVPSSACHKCNSRCNEIPQANCNFITTPSASNYFVKRVLMHIKNYAAINWDL